MSFFKQILNFIQNIIFNLYFLFITLFMGLGALPIRLLQSPKIALKYAKIWSQLVIAGFRIICHVKIIIKGKENLTHTPLIIYSQHQSFFDGFIWMILLQKPVYIIKEELTKIPLVGPMLKLTGMIPVNRKGGAKSLKKMLQLARKKIQENKQIILFPQGTRTQPGEYKKLQAGTNALAKISDKPIYILPVVTNSGIFWSRSIWKKRSGSLKVIIGKPLFYTDQKDFRKDIEKAWSQLEQQ